LGVFPTILANNAKGTHLYNRVLAALNSPRIMLRKKSSAGWTTPLLLTGEIFVKTKLWAAKAS
jgi:hypothetical protein